MNKKYIEPQIRVISIAFEGLVAGSGDRIGYSSDAATHSANPDDDVLSNRRSGSMWNED